MGKSKRGICMAEGGITQETPEQLMARMSAKYGVPLSPPTTQQTQAKTPAPPPAQAAPQGIATLAGVAGIMANRKATIDKASNYANGGIVKGKGTPTSDDVPVKINGADYNLSDTEVVLPSKTRQALGEMLGAKPGNVAQANSLVEKYIEQTNGKPPVQVEEGTNLAAGGLLDDEAIKQNYQNVTGISAPAPIPSPAANAPAGGMSFGQSPAPTIYGNGGLPADVVQRGIETMRGQLAKPQAPSPASSGIAAASPVAAGIQARPWYAGTDSRDERSGIEMERERRAQAMQAGVLNDPIKSALQYGVVGSSPVIDQTKQAASAPINVSASSGFGPQGNFGQPSISDIPARNDAAFMTGKAQYDETGLNKTGMATPDSSGGGFTQKGVSYNVNPSSQEGITKITSTKTNPLYTNIRPEDAVAGLKNQMVGGDAANVQQGLDRHARANAITQSIIDKQTPGGIGMLNDPNNVEAANAEKTARWRQDDLIAKAARNPAAGQVALASANGQNAMGVEEMRQQGDAARNAVAMRGQDIALARADGSPEERQLKQAQAQGIMAQTESSKMLADIQKKALAGDAQAAASYRALTGKSGADYKDRYITLPNRKVYNDMGQIVGEESGGLFDAATGKPVDSGAGQPKQGGAQKFSSPADVAAAKAAGTIKSGDVIETPNGLIKVK